jgi:iron complex outermembrane receptor protein
MVGVVVDIAPQANLYATYSSAFETPTTTELNQPDTSGGFNSNLDPQVARNLEVGVRGSLGLNQRYEVALFTIDVEDELIPFEVVGNPGRNFFQNAGESTRDGVEFSWIANPTERLQAIVSYTYSDFKFSEFVDAGGTDFAGNAIPGTSENVLFGEIAYASPRGWFAAADFMYVDEQFGDNANAVVIDDYTLTNLRLGYDVDLGDFTLSPFLGINNLLDETYTANVRLNAFGGRFFEPGPGRNGYAGVTLNWKY